MPKTVNKTRTEGDFHSNGAKKPNNPILLPDRDARIAKIAYEKAKSRNFLPGYELDDWLEAEKEFSF